MSTLDHLREIERLAAEHDLSPTAVLILQLLAAIDEYKRAEPNATFESAARILIPELKRANL
jgi:hypothetical protein